MQIKKLAFNLLLLLLIPFTLFSQQKVTAPKSGDTAPIFFLKTYDDEDFYLRDWCGKLRQPWKQKTKHHIILSFFASWCEPCMKEIPILEKISKAYQKQNLKVYLVNLKEENATVKNLLTKIDISIPILMDRYGVVADKYGVQSIPKLILIDKEGKVRFIHDGYSVDLEKKLNDEISRLLRKS